MHASIGALALVLLAAGFASASEDKKEPSAQTQRMAECSAQAGDRKLSGDARKQFVSECVKARPSDDSAGATKTSSRRKSGEGGQSTQAEKMKTCNQEASAKNLHKDDRRQFMSECLKGDKKS